jgi:hypothetical protein
LAVSLGWHNRIADENETVQQSESVLANGGHVQTPRMMASGHASGMDRDISGVMLSVACKPALYHVLAAGNTPPIAVPE